MTCSPKLTVVVETTVGACKLSLLQPELDLVAISKALLGLFSLQSLLW